MWLVVLSLKWVLVFLGWMLPSLKLLTIDVIILISLEV